MFSRGEYNLGHLCREEFGELGYAVGFGTHTGTVAAASNWDGPMDIKTVLPSIPDSYEHVCHPTGKQSFLLNLRRTSFAQATVRACDWGDLSAGNGARQPLFPGRSAGTVRRIRLV
jgi:erythromycin esterase-like protein